MRRGPKDTGAAVSQNRAKNRERSLANLKRFQPGQSGNPGGRPKKKPITEIYEELLAEGITRDDIKKTMRALVRKKNGLAVQALREMADRIEGRAQGNEDVHVTGLENLAEEIAQARKRAGVTAD
jgi:Family of unknown function (DUF5681)